MKHEQITAWIKDWSLMLHFFTETEVKIIADQLRRLEIANVVYCAYENRFAKSGGLGAVAGSLPSYLKAANPDVNVIVMTPFHSEIIDAAQLTPTHRRFTIEYDQRPHDVEIFAHPVAGIDGKGGSVTEYYLKIDGWFNARNRLDDPYIFDETNPEKNESTLRENVMLFCQAVPLALKALGIDRNIVLHLQDWHTALLALTSKLAMRDGILSSCGSVITLHNVYDCFIPWQELGRFVGSTTLQQIERQFPGGLTALQIGLPLADAPITTVSRTFAQELTTDILQTEYFVPHLQPLLRRSKVIGIPNGSFVPFPEKFAPEQRLSLQNIRDIKLKSRNELLQVLEQYHLAERIGTLTYQDGSISQLPDTIPIVVMAGRLDFNQKGYDIALQCLEQFGRDEIKAVLTPLVASSGHLEFIREAVMRCHGNVMAFPMRMKQGYQELLMGSSFGLMPSIYEPFGAALEYLVHGTVVIARRTGGLADQIQDHRCGLLYREPHKTYRIANIREFFSLANDLPARRANPWFQGMVTALHEKLTEAIHLYQHHRDEYYRLIIMGFKQARSFDWSTAADRYFKIYQLVNQGFY